MTEEPKVLLHPGIRFIFEGGVQTLYRDNRQPVTLIVYAAPEHPDEESETTVGILDYERDLYFEVSFRGDMIVNCRKYTPDNFSHGIRLEEVRRQYLNILTERLPASLKRRLFGMFLPNDQGIDRHVGGFAISGMDAEGCYHEIIIEVENSYL